jgi:endonuclease/exonuclease/phosphatase family metal-dependent hydrolase
MTSARQQEGDVKAAARRGPIAAVARRATIALSSVLLVFTLSGNSCQQAGEVISAVVKDTFRISVMTLNVGGTEDEIWGVTVKWRTRYARITQWMKDAQTTPDLILLQEIAARKFFWPAALYPHDYEGLHYLIREANAATGAEYRIAYMATKGTPRGTNYLTSGLALIYNSARLRNITSAAPGQLMPAEDTPSVTGFHPRKSWPCKEPHPEFADRCGLLDGEGVFYTSGFTALNGRRNFEAAGAAFVYVADTGARVDVFNVHLHPDPPPDHLKSATYSAARELVDQMTGQAGKRILPAILAGDFNGGTEAFPNFQVSSADDVDAVTTGNQPATYRPVVVRSEALPSAPSRPAGWCAPSELIWSDHCAVFVQFEPGPA